MSILLLPATVVVYLIFPFFYFMSEGKVPAATAKKIALINSIVGATVFILIRVATGYEAIGAGGFAPAVLYYFIAKAILTDKNPEPPRPLPQENKETISQPEQITNEKIITTSIINEDNTTAPTPRENITQFLSSTFVTVLMPERKGYGYEIDNPIEVASPFHQVEFIRSVIPNNEKASDIRLVEAMRTGVYRSATHNRLVDEYEIVYTYEINNHPHLELFVLYFTFYPLAGEDQDKFIRKTFCNDKCPECLKKVKIKKES